MAMRSNQSLVGGLLDIALEISAHRLELQSHMKAALERGDDEGALLFARKLCGLPEKPDEAPAQEMRIPVPEANLEPPSPPSPVLAVSLEEAARLLSLSVYTVRAWKRKGLIKVVRFGRRVLISTAELQRLSTEGLPNAK
jgi:excisionase family DNA binding protein